ncbi:MAG: poly-beta-hydroxybutyrate polymerase N-terminal domain-containing protein, partial [Telluria sp.]
MNQPGFVPAAVQERDASDWQGTRHRYPETEIDHATDLPLQALLGRLTGNVSPAALAMAWFDWTSHLLLSPNKQLELATHAGEAGLRWLQYCAGAAVADAAAPLAPLAQDKRFEDPEWQRWPYNVLSQCFL